MAGPLVRSLIEIAMLFDGRCSSETRRGGDVAFPFCRTASIGVRGFFMSRRVASSLLRTLHSASASTNRAALAHPRPQAAFAFRQLATSARKMAAPTDYVSQRIWHNTQQSC